MRFESGANPVRHAICASQGMRLFALIFAALAFGAQAALTAPASELIGKSVIDPARADLGRVQDLIVDLRESRVHYAVLGFGGWAGLFDKQFAIPIEEFTPAPFGDKLVLERAKELLLLEPGIDSRGVPLRQYVRARALLGRDVVDRTGEALGELRDFEIDLATGEVRRALLAAEGDLRRVPVQKLLAPASGAALVLNIEQREESP
jgi:sporulation protein YlmC with PRC-barrel domain